MAFLLLKIVTGISAKSGFYPTPYRTSGSGEFSRQSAGCSSNYLVANGDLIELQNENNENNMNADLNVNDDLRDRNGNGNNVNW